MKKFNNKISDRLTGRHRFSFVFAENLKNKKILDIGCSFGWFEKYAIEKGCKSIVGMEPEQKLIYGAKKEVPGAKFIVGSALDIPVTSKSVDKVVMFDVIEHIPINTEPIALLEVNRVLKNNGLFYLSTDYDYWISKIFDPAWYFGHRHYGEKKLKKMFNKAGFKILDIQVKGRYYEMFGTILMYIFKWIFNSEIPLKKFFDKKKNEEFLGDQKGFVTIFVKAKKIRSIKAGE